MNNRFSHFSLFSKLGILIFLMIPAVQSLQAQTIYYVNAAAPGGGDGTSWNNAIADLQIALDNACQHTPSSLWVAQGIYYPIQNPSGTSTGPLDRTNTFLLCNGVSIYGGFAGTETSMAERDWSTYLTVLSGDIDHNDSLSNNTFNVVTCIHADTTVVLDGFIVTGGFSTTSNNIENQYSGGGMFNINSSPRIKNSIFKDNMAISGGGMCNNSSAPHLVNCLFQNNMTPEFGTGGGMFNFHSNPILVNCKFNSNNSGSSGGAIRNLESSIFLDSCLFSGNISDRGGAMYSTTSNNSIHHCQFISNTALNDGGALYNITGTQTELTGCIFSGNDADASGGGMYNSISAQTHMSECILEGNKARTGGGINNGDASVSVFTNSVIRGNSADSDGGGLYCHGSVTHLINCTISGNISKSNGGGLYNFSNYIKLINSNFCGNYAVKDGGALYNRSSFGPFVTNCIFWNNQVSAGVDVPSASIRNVSGYHPLISYSLVANSGGSSNWVSDIGDDYGNNLDVDPLFLQGIDPDTIPNPAGDFHLQSTSPCINAGTLDTTGLMLTKWDADGLTRIKSGRIDLGAYEFQDMITSSECDISGPEIMVSFSTESYTAPAGMASYAWSIEGHGKIMGMADAQNVMVQAGAVNSFLLTLTLTDSTGLQSTCAMNVNVQTDCSYYDPSSRLYVNADATGDEDGTSWANAFTDLQDALRISCNSIHEIWVAQGNYRPSSLYFDREATFALKNNLTVYGGFLGNEQNLSERNIEAYPTYLNGDIDYNGALDGSCYHTVTAFEVDSTAVLDGFIIRGGNADMISGGLAAYAEGGGMLIKDASPVLNLCTFEGNLAGSGGGCMNNHSSPKIRKCIFRDNMTGLSGSGAGLSNTNGSSPELTECTFSQNISSRLGGGMYNNASAPSLWKCAFEENEVMSGLGSGAGMYNNASSPILSECIFKNNKSNGSGVGGGMTNQTNSTPLLMACVFETNTAKRGAGLFNDNNANTELTDCMFIGNETSFEGIGGGMYNEDGAMALLTRCYFQDNFGYNYGGGIFNEDASIILNECTFSANETYEYGGGGVCNRHATAILKDCSFNANISSFFGGGLYNDNGASVDMKDCAFIENEAINGAGVYLERDSFSTIQNILFNRNAALGSGGGLEAYESRIKLTNCNFLYNTAGFDGGGVLNYSNSSLNLINCQFAGNTAMERGGAVDNTAVGSINMVNCTLSGNTSMLEGGAFNNDFLSFAKLTNCILWNNSVEGDSDLPASSIFNDSTATASLSYCLIANSGGSLNWNESIGNDLGHNLDVDPDFIEEVDLEALPDSSGDLRLMRLSTASNTGTPDTVGLMLIPIDLDGNPRISGGIIDLGAFEYQEIVGLSKIDRDVEEIHLAPNPAENIIQVWGRAGIGELTIINMKGQIVNFYPHIELNPDTGFEIKTSHLSPGIYSIYFHGEYDSRTVLIKI